MGKYWDKLFHEKKYNDILDKYSEIKRKYQDGLRIFIADHKEYEGREHEYDVKKAFWENYLTICQLQKQYDEEQAITKKAKQIIANNRKGFSYYSRINNLPVSLHIENYRRIIADERYIIKKETEINEVERLIIDCPEGSKNYSRSKGVEPASLNLPYVNVDIKEIDCLTGAKDIVKKYQECHNLKTQHRHGYRLANPSIMSDILSELQVKDILQKKEEIVAINSQYEDFLSLHEQYPVEVELYLKQKWADYVFDNETLSLDMIHFIVWSNSLSEEINDMSSSEKAIVKALKELSPSQRRLYLLRYVTESYVPDLSIPQTDKPECIVSFLMKKYPEIETSGVTLKKYYETYQILNASNHSISSAVSECKEMKGTVLKFYGKEESDKIPFSALTGVYINILLIKKIKDKKDLDKLNYIIRTYNKGFRALVEKKVIRDFYIDHKVSKEEIKWVLENESRFIEEQRIVEQREREERERKEKQERLDEAKQLLSNYAKAANYLLPNISRYSLSDSDARTVINKKTDLDDLSRLFNSVSNWDTVKGIPHYFFYYYYPKNRYPDSSISSESVNARIMVWDFKNGSDQETVKDIVVKKLRSTFGSDCSKLTLVCVPASNKYDNEDRYKDFANHVTSQLNMYNGFDYIKITKDRTPNHMGGTDPAEYSFVTSFFNGKRIVLFDDVVTRGHSMQWFKETLESYGAIVICCMSIGRTYSDYYGDNRQPHPWSGRL